MPLSRARKAPAELRANPPASKVSVATPPAPASGLIQPSAPSESLRWRRSAAKNHDSVTVVTDPADYAEVADQIAAQGATTLENATEGGHHGRSSNPTAHCARHLLRLAVATAPARGLIWAGSHLKEQPMYEVSPAPRAIERERGQGCVQRRGVRRGRW